MGAGGGSREDGQEYPQFESLEAQTKLVFREDAGPWNHQPRPQAPGTFMVCVDREGWLFQGCRPLSIVVKILWLQIPALPFARCETFGKYLTFVNLSFFIAEMKTLGVVSVKWLNVYNVLSTVPSTW